jgi:hypothetical protein
MIQLVIDRDRLADVLTAFEVETEEVLGRILAAYVNDKTEASLLRIHRGSFVYTPIDIGCTVTE